MIDRNNVELSQKKKQSKQERKEDLIEGKLTFSDYRKDIKMSSFTFANI